MHPLTWAGISNPRTSLIFIFVVLAVSSLLFRSLPPSLRRHFTRFGATHFLILSSEHPFGSFLNGSAHLGFLLPLTGDGALVGSSLDVWELGICPLGKSTPPARILRAVCTFKFSRRIIQHVALPVGGLLWGKMSVSLSLGVYFSSASARVSLSLV